jgi:hypothetical protein
LTDNTVLLLYEHRGVNMNDDTAEIRKEHFPTQHVLAASILAMEENQGEYVGSKDNNIEKPQNKILMMQFLHSNDPRLEDRMPAAEEMIAYCQTKMIELLSGSLTSYWKSILEVVNKPEISAIAYSDCGILASVPSAYLRAVERDNAHDRRESAMRTSQHFGKIGDAYQGTVHVFSKIFSIKYNKTWYTGVDEHGNLVNFPFAKSLIVDRDYPVKGKIRKHGNDLTTLLHYVNIPVDSIT